MKLFVALAIFEGCPQRFLDSGEELGRVLDAAILAGKFTALGRLVVPFSPQGVTACAIVGESHLALHSWPEEGRLFVDIASCSTAESVQSALSAIAQALPEGKLSVLDERVIDSGGARAP